MDVPTYESQDLRRGSPSHVGLACAARYSERPGESDQCQIFLVMNNKLKLCLASADCFVACGIKLQTYQLKAKQSFILLSLPESILTVRKICAGSVEQVNSITNRVSAKIVNSDLPTELDIDSVHPTW